MSFLENNFFLLAITFGIFFFAKLLQKKTGLVLLNPILLTIAKQVECKDHNAQDHGRYDQSVSISVHTAKCVCCHGSKAWKRCRNTNSKVG